MVQEVFLFLNHAQIPLSPPSGAEIPLSPLPIPNGEIKRKIPCLPASRASQWSFQVSLNHSLIIQDPSHDDDPSIFKNSPQIPPSPTYRSQAMSFLEDLGCLVIYLTGNRPFLP